MKFVITSAGMGSRFAKVGITCSKYEIKAKGQSLFYLSMIGLKKYFDSEFIFLFRKGFYSEQFIADEIKKLGIKKFQIKLVDELTDGQASTALLADEFMQPNDEFCIFNTDTYVLPKALDNLDFNVDGLVPCFKVEGDHWSFVKTQDGTVNTKAVAVSEKVRISDMASIGFYYFKKWSDFKTILTTHKDEIKKNYKEAYIAPMYQYLINDSSKVVKAALVKKEDVIALGTPDEIALYDKDWFDNNPHN